MNFRATSHSLQHLLPPANPEIRIPLRDVTAKVITWRWSWS